MDVKTAVSLLLAGQGIPPEATALVYEKLEDLNELMMSAIARNRAIMIAAKVQAARELLEMPPAWQPFVGVLFKEVSEDLAEEEEETEPDPEAKPPEAASA